MINASTCFFTHWLLVFLTSVFDVRRYNCSCLSCSYAPRPMKITAFIVESVEKNMSISSTHRCFKILP